MREQIYFDRRYVNRCLPLLKEFGGWNEGKKHAKECSIEISLLCVHLLGLRQKKKQRFLAIK